MMEPAELQEGEVPIKGSEEKKSSSNQGARVSSDGKHINVKTVSKVRTSPPAQLFVEEKSSNVKIVRSKNTERKGPRIRSPKSHSIRMVPTGPRGSRRSFQTLPDYIEKLVGQLIKNKKFEEIRLSSANGGDSSGIDEVKADDCKGNPGDNNLRLNIPPPNYDYSKNIGFPHRVKFLEGYTTDTDNGEVQADQPESLRRKRELRSPKEVEQDKGSANNKCPIPGSNQILDKHYVVRQVGSDLLTNRIAQQPSANQSVDNDLAILSKTFKSMNIPGVTNKTEAASSFHNLVENQPNNNEHSSNRQAQPSSDPIDWTEIPITVNQANDLGIWYAQSPNESTFVYPNPYPMVNPNSNTAYNNTQNLPVIQSNPNNHDRAFTQPKSVPNTNSKPETPDKTTSIHIHLRCPCGRQFKKKKAKKSVSKL